jgi:ABC-type multidrug transport system fused ATPase/permease subunit
VNKIYTPFKPPAQFWKKSWTSIAQLIVNGLLKSSLVIASYKLIKSLSSDLRSGVVINTAILWILISIALFLVMLRVHERYTSEKMSQKYINRVRSGLLKRIMRASVRLVQDKTIGNLSSRLAGDLSSIKRWLSLGIARLVTHSLLLIITTALIFNINLKLGSIIALTITALIIMSALVGNHLKHSIKNVRRNRI